MLILTASLCLFFNNIFESYNALQSAQKVTKQWDDAVKKGNFKKKEMQSVLIDGNFYIGKIKILPLKLTLPVMKDWSYDNLKKAPCRYSGSLYKNNMIIMAHNYRGHFGRLYKLKRGDDILFEDVRGDRFYYKVDEVETLSSDDVDEIELGDFDLTLFTCTVGGRNRVVVRCFEVKANENNLK